MSVCGVCGTGNDHDGTFCFRCGSKLGSDAPDSRQPWLFQEGAGAGSVKPVVVKAKNAAAKRTKKPAGARVGPSVRGFLNRLVGLIVASFILACLVAICRPPVALPAQNTTGHALAVMQVIAQAKASRGADVAELSEPDVNAYLAQRTGPRGFLFDNLCRFDGLLVSFRPKTCYVFSRYSVFGCPIYLSGIYTAQEDFGRPVFVNRGGSIGRLAIAPLIMGMAQYPFFGELWNGFGIERETLSRYRRVEFEQGLMKLVPLQ